MPLRNTEALDEWARRENPPYTTWRIVSEWIQSLDATPRQAPSVPFPELSDLPHFEVRYAEPHGTDGVAAFYRREFLGEVVDLIWVGRLPRRSGR
ncbi:MAG: hypothetical protein SGJ13_03570 [Actinomycetota bacterium]|nr:hypothetical protein [Actinomycetota bacterium]